ncbi:hypothetical protein GC207_01765 [bacterium]|nr:hypothetical protein [bacterium]
MIILWRIIEALLGILCFIAWVLCMIDWVRGGCRVPRLVHYFAFGCLVAGCIITAVVVHIGGFTIGTVVSCALLPPVLVYVLWLWGGGPWASDRKQ